MFSHALQTFFGFFRKKEFTTRGGYLEIARIAYPLIIMSASHTVMQFVDRKFLAVNSTLDVSAAFPAGILYFTLFCIYMVTANFTSALVAQHFAAKQYNQCVRAVWTGFYFAIASSLLIIFVNPIIGEWMMRKWTSDPDILERELAYFSSLGGSGVFCCIAAPFFAFFTGQGRTAVAAVVNIGACVLNIFLDWLFIFGCKPIGLPALGIFGAGIATSLCTMSSMIAVLWYYLAQKQTPFATRKNRAFNFEYVRKLLRYGIPSGTQVFLDTGAFTLVTFALERMGKEALASSVIALAINNIFFMPLMGLSDATSIVVGQYIGRRQYNTAASAAYRSWRIGILYMMMGGVLYLGTPDLLISIFAPGGDGAGGGIDFQRVIETSRTVLFIAMFFNFFDATKFIFAGALRGAGDTLAVLIINSGCAWTIMVPSIVLMTGYLNSSIYAVWTFLAAYTLCESLLIFWRFRTNHWRKIRLIHVEHKTVSKLPLEELTNPPI